MTTPNVSLTSSFLNWEDPKNRILKGGTRREAHFNVDGKDYILKVDYSRVALAKKYGIKEGEVDQFVQNLFNEMDLDALQKMCGYQFATNCENFDSMRYRPIGSKFHNINELQSTKNKSEKKLYSTLKKINDILMQRLPNHKPDTSKESEITVEVLPDDEASKVEEKHAGDKRRRNELRELEDKFWNTLYEDEELHDKLNEVFKSPSQQGFKSFIDAYENKLGLSLNNVEKRQLFNILKEQVSQPSTPSLTRDATYGDGSCAFHALFGKPTPDKGYYCTDFQAKRDELCKWLKDKHSKGTLPDQIKNVLADYYLEPKYAPAGFKNRIANIAKPSNADDFIKNQQIFDAYLAELAKPGNYILQDELAAAAECFDLKVNLHQPGWGNDKGNIRKTTLNPSGTKGTVDIWYNGRSHFEHATAAGTK